MKDLSKLWVKKLFQGLRRLRRLGIGADRWNLMVDADDASLQPLECAWPGAKQPAVPLKELADTDSQARCRELFDADFFGMKDAAGPYGYAFSPQEAEERKPVRILARDGSLLSEEQSWDLIRRCRDEAPGEFILGVGVPHSIVDVHAEHTDVFHSAYRVNPWFAAADQRTKWSNEKVPDFWFLLKKEVVDKSWSMSAADQESWLPKTHRFERFARPPHLVYGHTLCVKVTNGKLRLLSGDRWARTLARTAHGLLVLVGCDPDGLGVNYWYDGPFSPYGVASLWTSEA